MSKRPSTSRQEITSPTLARQESFSSTEAPAGDNKLKYQSRGAANDPYQGMVEELDSSFDFKEDTKEHQKLFEKTAQFSYL